MTEELNTELVGIGIRLLDDAYLAWFSAESETDNALWAWRQSTGASRSAASAAYRAALDREEAAARDLERLWTLSQSCRNELTVAARGE
jgi:hypothetical protein